MQLGIGGIGLTAIIFIWFMQDRSSSKNIIKKVFELKKIESGGKYPQIKEVKIHEKEREI